MSRARLLARTGWLLWIWASTGCMSMSNPAPTLSPEMCLIDSRVAGSWSDARMTQLGPAWVSLTPRCDCTYAYRIQLLWMRINERGNYRSTGEAIVFERSNGRQTIWRYRKEGTTLRLTESVDETHTYGRDRVLTCQLCP